MRWAIAFCERHERALALFNAFAVVVLSAMLLWKDYTETPCNCAPAVAAAIDSVRAAPYHGEEIGIVTIKGTAFLVFSNGNGIELQELEVAP